MVRKEYYKKLFPLLTDYELELDSESDYYNCISLTISKYDIPSWPTNSTYYWPTKRVVSIESFDEFYKYHGFYECGMDFSYEKNYTKVALYVNNGKPTHGALQVDDLWWKSKIGAYGVIKHDLFELEDDVYGEVFKIYKKLNKIDEDILYFREFIKLF